jgi:FlaA1/EpsC-like NDP-sugar epimerase
MGTDGGIFVLDMGEPVRIVDLAYDLIRLSGLPENAIEIVFSGVRPGEKLYEQLNTDEEETIETSHSKVKAAYHRPWSLSEVRRSLSAFEEWLDESDEVIREKLQEMTLDRPTVGPPSFGSESSAKESRRSAHPLPSGTEKDRSVRSSESRVATARVPEHR